MKCLGFPEVRKLLHNLLKRLAAADDDLYEGKGLGTDLLNIVYVNTNQYILNLVRHLVDTLAQKNNILPLNGGDKRLDQHSHHLMLFLVRVMFNPVQLVQLVL